MKAFLDSFRRLVVLGALGTAATASAQPSTLVKDIKPGRGRLGREQPGRSGQSLPVRGG